jgi:hypothetical protein
MSKHNIIKFDPTVPAKFEDWFGPPALTNEELQIYKNMLCGVCNDVKPQGFIELTLVEDLAYNLLRRLQLRGRRANVRRQVHNQKFEQQERELVRDGERRKEEIRRLFDVRGPLRRPNGRDPLTDTKLMIELEINEDRLKKQLAEIDAETDKKLAKVQKAKEAPIDEAACFDQWIDKEERIDEQLVQVDHNIRITLKLLDEHRTGLGQRLRQVADEIVDGDFAEVETLAREEAADGSESACSTETTTALAEPTTPSTVAESPLPASVKTNGGGANLDVPATRVPPPRSSPAEHQEVQQELKE